MNGYPQLRAAVRFALLMGGAAMFAAPAALAQEQAEDESMQEVVVTGLPLLGGQAAQQGVFGEMAPRKVGAGDQPIETPPGFY